MSFVAAAAALALLGSAGAPRPIPAWVDGAVFYGAVPPLFGPRALVDMRDRLDELQAMGFDALWLSPLYPSDDDSQISYAVTDERALRSDFGSPTELKELIAAAHERGLRIILDIVPNHASRAHPWFQQARAQGPSSPYFDWFEWRRDGSAASYFGWDHLVNWNCRNPAVRQHLENVFGYWLTEYDVDGFRVDAAWGLRERCPEFWPAVTAKLQRQKPDLFLLAEASARDDYYVENGFTAAYDWTDSPGQWAWDGVFDLAEQAGARLRARVRGRGAMERVARFINNNDTGDRFITRFGPGMTRVAATLMHTLPGIPVVYMGDEVGAEFRPYDDGPPLGFADTRGLRAHYRRLAQLRQGLPALRQGTFDEVRTMPRNAVYAFVRRTGPKDLALVLLNFGPSTEVTLEPPEAVLGVLSESGCRDVLGDKRASCHRDGASLSVHAAAMSSQIIIPASARDPSSVGAAAGS